MAKKNQSLINGALILSAAIIAVKIIGVFFKIYVTYKIGMEGKSYYATAYALYTPVYSIALAGLPTAVAKMVAAKAAQGCYKDVKKLFKVSVWLFSFLGAVGTAVIVLVSVPFASSVSDGVLNAVPAIIAIAPSLFFCCVMSGYRGYYQGLGSMTPSAVSQVFEAGGKLIFGWLFINIVIGTGASFADEIPYFKDIITEKQQAWAAAAAIAGVTVGSLMGLLYLVLRRRFDRRSITTRELRNSPEAEPSPGAYSCTGRRSAGETAALSPKGRRRAFMLKTRDDRMAAPSQLHRRRAVTRARRRSAGMAVRVSFPAMNCGSMPAMGMPRVSISWKEGRVYVRPARLLSASGNDRPSILTSA